MPQPFTRLRNDKEADCHAPNGACNDKEIMNRRGIKEPQIKKAKYDLKIDYINKYKNEKGKKV